MCRADRKWIRKSGCAIDGLLELASRHDIVIGRSLVIRLMVMAKTPHLSPGCACRKEQLSFDPAGIGFARWNCAWRLCRRRTVLRAAVRLPAELVQPRNAG